MNSGNLFDNILELIRITSTILPPDVSSLLGREGRFEEKGSKADLALRLVKQNIGQAEELIRPICQDTGTITFYVKTPIGFDQIELENQFNRAVEEATSRGYLRQNSVDSLSGKNSGNNLGPGSPVYHWDQHDKDHLEIKLILKGGGCENMSAQYSLPTTLIGKRFDRDLAGVRACILDAVLNAQGKGCGPGFLGVCIGGDRANGYEAAKKQLLRKIDHKNPVRELAELEERILEEANRLEIGPMGFGGNLTLGSCKIGMRNRLPASFFVTIAYMCWAYRRRGVTLDKNGQIIEWLYHEKEQSNQKVLSKMDLGDAARTAIPLKTPLTENNVRHLKAGDVVLLSGTLFTGRDEVHRYLFKGGELPVLQDGVIYHCGPVILQENNQYRVIAAGPTTSIREEPYQADLIKKYGIRGIIGKGGMGKRTLDACQEYGCVYLHAIGGAAQIYAGCIQSVENVYLEEFGSPEAVWQLRVKDFPAVVTMDTHGRSLHDEVLDVSLRNLSNIL